MTAKLTKALQKELKLKEILTSKEASLYTGLSDKRISIRRFEGLPPRYFKVDGRVFYKVCELEFFLKSYPLQGRRGRGTPRRWYDDGSFDEDIFSWEDEEYLQVFYGVESKEVLDKARRRLQELSMSRKDLRSLRLSSR